MINILKLYDNYNNIYIFKCTNIKILYNIFYNILKRIIKNSEIFLLKKHQ